MVALSFAAMLNFFVIPLILTKRLLVIPRSSTTLPYLTKQSFDGVPLVSSWHPFLLLMWGIASVLLAIIATIPTEAAPPTAECEQPWAVSQVKLKDHSIFFHDGYYYVISIHIPLPSNDATAEKTFIHARTTDFCHWELRGTVLTIGNPGDADENRIWAPYVVAEGDTYYLFYTGANNNIAQSIMLATSQTPEDPASWVKRGVVFQPNHEGMIYAGPSEWSDGRDAMILPYNGRYYLYYTGRDSAGPIVGVAVSDHLVGPWQDLGAVVTEHDTGAYFESPFVLEHAGYYYLFYNASLPGQPAREEWRWAPSPFGPWQEGVPIDVGWAHEFIRVGETWYTSFLIGNGNAIQVLPLQWDESLTTVPTPSIGNRIFAPFIRLGDRRVP